MQRDCRLIGSRPFSLFYFFVATSSHFTADRSKYALSGVVACVLVLFIYVTNGVYFARHVLPVVVAHSYILLSFHSCFLVTVFVCSVMVYTFKNKG